MVPVALTLWFYALAVTSGVFVAVVAVQLLVRSVRRARARVHVPAPRTPAVVERRRAHAA